MKKVLFTLLFALPVMAMAQSAEVNVSASVEGTLTLTKVSDLVFGNIADAETAAVVSAIDPANNANVSTAASRAAITANATTPITYTIPASATLTSITTSDQITVDLSFAIGATPTAYTSGNSTNASVAADNNLFIGGTIPSNQMTGKEGQAFTGSITVTAVFN